MIEVSVILPVRNADSTLSRSLQSIQNQTCKNWELIIVEDRSKDNTQAIASEFANADPRIVLMLNEGCGIVDALNNGIEKSKGRYIARMDADDWAHPRRLELQARYLSAKKEVGLVATRVNHRGNSSQQEGYARYVDWTNTLTRWPYIRANRFVESPFAHPSVMFKRSIIGEYGGYRNGPFPEDYELWLRWMSRGVIMAKLEEYLLDWHDSGDRLSRIDPRYSTEAFYRVKAQYLGAWIKETGLLKRPIWIWGAGRITRKRARYLQEEGIRFSGYIDIDPKKAGKNLEELPVVQPDEIKTDNQPFVLSYVASRGASSSISSYLNKRGLIVEQDYILAA
tara:strand:- start:10224 stop:11237 length:1014 start_codon:yes stop_codon:yes gene_type:complete